MAPCRAIVYAKLADTAGRSSEQRPATRALLIDW